MPPSNRHGCACMKRLLLLPLAAILLLVAWCPPATAALPGNLDDLFPSKPINYSPGPIVCTVQAWNATSCLGLICDEQSAGGILPCNIIQRPLPEIAVGCGDPQLPINPPPYPPVNISGPLVWFGPYYGYGILCFS